MWAAFARGEKSIGRRASTEKRRWARGGKSDRSESEYGKETLGARGRNRNRSESEYGKETLGARGRNRNRSESEYGKETSRARSNASS